jgi:hypothetical protein
MPSARLAARPAVHPSGDSRRPYGRRPTLAALVAVIAFLGVLGAAIVSAGPAGAAVTPPAQGWNSTEAALPANAGTATTLGNVIISSSSCPAVNGCVSVGGYHDTGTLPWGVIETQNGTSWTETQAPEPSNAGTGGNQGFWFGSQNCGNSQPCRAVSCPSAGFCVAVGEFSDSAGFDQPVVDTLANGAWTSAQGALPSDAATDSTTVNPDAWLYSVSCSSSTSCVAVGTYRNTSDNENGFVATLSGTTWSAQAAPLPSNANTTGSVLVAVSCPSATFCVGAGSYPDDTAGNPSNGWLVVDANGTWTGTTAPQPAGAGDDADGHQDSIESGVACPSAASCVATGHYADASANNWPLIDTWNGTGWTGLQGPVPSGASTAPTSEQLVSVSCGSPSSCVGAGFYQNTSLATFGLIDTLSNGSWSATAAPQPANTDATAQAAHLDEVSCPTPSFCLTVGSYVGTAATGFAFLDTLSGGTWRALEAPLPPNVSTTTGSTVAQGRVVACNSPVSCAVGGDYLDTNGNGQGYLDADVGPQGYWLGAADGGIFNYGNTTFFGSRGGQPLNEPVVGMAVTPDQQGYWMVASDGGIFSYGDATFFGSRGGQPLNAPIVGMAATPDGKGYWLVASDGGIFSYGDATFYGSRGGQPLNKPIVGMAATPDGKGYWLVASDGGIFSYGDATFYGSTGSLVLNQPVVGMASTPTGLGYWLVAADGGIFNYGNAAFYGSTGSIHLNKPVVGMASSPSGNGYFLVASDGGIFNYGDAPFYGSAGGLTLVEPVVGMAG